MIYVHEQREKKGYTGPRPGYPKLDRDLWGMMKLYLRKRGLSYEVARMNDWYPSWVHFAPRLVIPCTNSENVPYYQARDMGGKPKLRYFSPMASRDDSLVVVWPLVRSSVQSTVVVEGPMDALAAAELGYLGIALMGNQPSTAVLSHLTNYVRPFQPVVVLPDADAVGMGPDVLCYLVQQGISGIILVPPKKDFADMTVLERKRFLRI